MLGTCIGVLEASGSFHLTHIASSTMTTFQCETSSMASTLVFGKSKWRLYWPRKTFGTLWTSPNVHHLMMHKNPQKMEYKRMCKKALAIIAMNLVGKDTLHIKGCKRPAQVWETLSNIHKTKCLSNIFFLKHTFFTIKMEKGTLYTSCGACSCTYNMG